MKAVSEMIARGIKIRLITDITKENINYCKDLSKVSEIRHIDGIKGNFGIIDEKEYIIHLIHKESLRPRVKLSIIMTVPLLKHSNLYLIFCGKTQSPYQTG